MSTVFLPDQINEMVNRQNSPLFVGNPSAYPFESLKIPRGFNLARLGIFKDENVWVYKNGTEYSRPFPGLVAPNVPFDTLPLIWKMLVREVLRLLPRLKPLLLSEYNADSESVTHSNTWKWLEEPFSKEGQYNAGYFVEYLLETGGFKSDFDKLCIRKIQGIQQIAENGVQSEDVVKTASWRKNLVFRP